MMIKTITHSIVRSITMTMLLVVIVCGFYPVLVTVIGKAFFSEKASGGLIRLPNNQLVGAKLIGQSFKSSSYFHGRPSSAGSGGGYDASNSSGSNLGPTNQKLLDALQTNRNALLKENPTLKVGKIPTDLITSSASGLDPHISPDSALVQVARVAQSRQQSEEVIEKLVNKHIEAPQWELLGESVVNVLLLNLDLDRLYPKKAQD